MPGSTASMQQVDAMLSSPSPDSKPFFASADLFIAFVGGLVALTLYLLTLAPTISGEDSGEFITAAATLGVAHPPGYPLYCLLGHLFSWMPLGTPAWRINFMSAFFSAASISLAILTVIYLTRNRRAALMAGLMLACTRDLWSQSVVAEVYTLTLFVLAASFLTLLLWSDRGEGRYLFFFAALCGTGITVHNTMLLILPPAVLFFLHSEYKAKERTSPALLFYACCCAALPFLLYLYLPLRSRANPLLDWGNPETLPLMLRHIFRSQYAFMVDQYPRDLGRFLEQLRVFLRFAREQAGLIPAVCGLTGLLLLLRQRKDYALFLLFSLLLIPAAFSFWQNFEITREWLWVMRVFGIPSWYILALGCGIFLHRLSETSQKMKPFFWLLAVSFILFPLVRNYRYNDKSDYYWVEDYARNLADHLEPGALFISESDHASFSLLYFQAVLGERRDVENIRRYGYLQTPLFDGLPKELKEKTGAFPPRRYDAELIAWLLDHTTRPLYVARPRPLPSQLFARYEACGPVFRALRHGENFSLPDTIRTDRRNRSDDTRGDYTADAILYEESMNRALRLFLSIRQDGTNPESVKAEVLEAVEKGLYHYTRDAAALNNVGTLVARCGYQAEALAYFEEASRLLPHSPEIRKNLQRMKATGDLPAR